MCRRHTHACAVCTQQIGHDFLMCPAHWRRVPPALQREVYRTLRAFRRAKGAQMALAARKAYLQARDAAIGSVAVPAEPPTTGDAA